MSGFNSELNRELRRGLPGEPDAQDTLDARKRGDLEAFELFRKHYRRDGSLTLTPNQIHNLKTRAVPRPPTPATVAAPVPPPPKNNKDLTPLERRQLELHGLFGGKTRKHSKRSRRLKNRKSTKKHISRRRGLSRKH